jgi:FkbH-like protein
VSLNWLPVREDWNDAVRSVKQLAPADAAPLLRALANSRLDFTQSLKLDRIFQRTLASANGTLPGLEPLRLALLGSSTLSHLAPGIRLAGLRRGLAIELYEAPFGLYLQELMDEDSGLHRFQPEAVLLALDARHLAAAEGATPESALDLLRSCWHQLRSAFPCQILQQAVLPIFPDLLGNNESRLPHSPSAIVTRLNDLLRSATAEQGIDLLALDRLAALHGLDHCYDPGLWHRSKQEFHPRAGDLYGEHVARLLAAARGKSSKCLVLDLDNTLWGGAIGEDGLHGIVLGPGSATGEAFSDFQRYLKQLAARGVILAVCSKNDAPNAAQPFDLHPEMQLKRSEIAAFVANWTDKATNLRAIAQQLQIGLESMVFLDDNPVERALIRRELPMVAVPELPEDPALFAQTLANTGLFESRGLTGEDLLRCQLYQANAARTQLQQNTTDMPSYLRSLRMVLTAQPFDSVDLTRITQLYNKTNQFNLTTERFTEPEVASQMLDPKLLTLQFRLSDRFGDSGIIALLTARLRPNGTEAVIDSFLMSCRVLGRHIEHACFNTLAEQCLALGISRLTGIYRPSPKNGLVAQLYQQLGFELFSETSSGETHWLLDLHTFEPLPNFCEVNVLREVLA